METTTRSGKELAIAFAVLVILIVVTIAYAH